MTAVSVLMATFNGARFISAQLETIRNQTLPPAELVVTDDGSSDETLRIVRDFAATSPFPVRVNQNPQRLGYGENFLTGTRLCGGSHIAFCDQDDEWEPRKLETCVAALAREDAVLCVHTATLIDGESKTIDAFDQGIEASAVREPLGLPPWDVYFGLTQVFRRDLLDTIPFEKRGLDNHAVGSPLSHDRWIQFLGNSFGRTVLLADPLVRYRQHGSNAYGGLRKGRLMRARGKLVASGEIMERHESIAAHRAAILDECRTSSADAEVRRHAERAAGYWSEIASRYGQRADLYREPHLARRARAFAAMARDGLYAAPDGFGRTVLIKDLALGVCRLPVGAIVPRDQHTSTTAPPASPPAA